MRVDRTRELLEPKGWTGAARAAALLLAAAVAVPGCALEEREGPEEAREPAWLAADLEVGEAAARTALAIRRAAARRRAERLYRHACAPCHGSRGDGKGPGAAPLDPQPFDFTLGEFAMGGSEDMFRAISRGVPGTAMPAWERLLSREDRWALVDYLRAFGEAEPR